jgi:hypothetical protein
MVASIPSGSPSDPMRLLPLLLLPCLLLVQSCWRGESADGLAVDLFLDQDSASVWDTLSGTIRLCNKWPNWTTVEYPNMQQAEVLFYDEQGELALNKHSQARSLVQQGLRFPVRNPELPSG